MGYKQRRLDSISRLMQRIWEELDRGPGPHATAELSRAWNGLIAEMNKLDGLYAPQKLQRHRLALRPHSRPSLLVVLKGLAVPALVNSSALLGRDARF